MGIRKSDLQKFIDEKSRLRKDEIKKAARVVVKDAIAPAIFDYYKDVDVVEGLAQKFHDALLLMKEQHGAIFQSRWRLTSIIGDVDSYFIGFRKGIVKEQASSLLYNLFDRGTNGAMAVAENSIPMLKKQLAKQISEYHDIVTLTDEISAIISGCHNGDKAYKRLQELGVDLTGFQFSGDNLPVIVKLSANVCVLNGNC